MNKNTCFQTTPNTTRLLIYIVPVIFVSFCMNIPKFLEVRLEEFTEFQVTVVENNGTNMVDPSPTRRDPTYVLWFTLSLLWHPTLTTGLLPFIGLTFMNTRIFISIRCKPMVMSLSL